MNKKLLLLSLFCFGLFTNVLKAQYPDVPNGSFENWAVSSGSTAEPDNWNSNKTGGGQAPNGPQTCFLETSNPYDGTRCVRIETVTYLVVFTVNGSCTTGKIEAPTTNKSDGYVHSIKNDPTYSSSFNGRPDSIIGYYRYNSSNSDQGKIKVVLHVGNYYDPETATSYHPDSTVNRIAMGTFLTPTSSVTTWRKFSIPLTYYDSRIPQYILISMTSSANQTGGSSGSKLWVDGMKAFYNPVLTTGTINPMAYIVSSASSSPITVPFTLTGTMNTGNVVTAQLSDASGSFASPVVLGTLTTTTSGSINGSIPAGTTTGSGYRVRVVSSNYALTAVDNGTDILISDVTGVESYNNTDHNIYFSENNLVAEIQSATLKNIVLRIYTIEGKEIACFSANTQQINRFELSIPEGVYIYTLTDGEQMSSGKVVKL